MVKNTDYIKANAFAFYSINGSNLINFKESSKAESICEFLEEIVGENRGKIIVFILDNSKAHKADKTKTKSRELGIILVFLPPYFLLALSSCSHYRSTALCFLFC
jgi:putative transposase